MPIAGSSIRHGPWVGGVRYDLPVEEQATNTLYEMSNTKVGLSGEVRKRLGYAKYIATALSSTTITAVGYAQFSASSANAFVVAGTVLYENMSGTWTERMPSSGVTITAAIDYDDTVHMVSIYHQANRPTRSAAHNILYVLHR